MAFKTEQIEDVIVKNKNSFLIKQPKKANVYLLNDDVTTMEFVIDILMDIFSFSYDDAQTIMFKVHTQGKGLCGTFSVDIAKTKVVLVLARAREAGYPLQAIYEEL